MRLQEAHAAHSFEAMEGVVHVSDSVAHLIRAYKACRWTVLVVALVALLAYPAAMIPAKLFGKRMYTNLGAPLNTGHIIFPRLLSVCALQVLPQKPFRRDLWGERLTSQAPEHVNR